MLDPDGLGLFIWFAVEVLFGALCFAFAGAAHEAIPLSDRDACLECPIDSLAAFFAGTALFFGCVITFAAPFTSFWLRFGAAAFSALLSGFLFTLLYSVGMNKYKSVYKNLKMPCALFVLVMKPFAWLMLTAINPILRGGGIDTTASQVTEEEILELVDTAGEGEIIDESSAEMINNIFELDDVTAGDIMTHRIEIVGLESDAAISDIIALSVETGRSRIIVYEDTLDTIVGMITVKDLLPYVGESGAGRRSIGDFVRPVLFVPQTRRANSLLIELRQKRIQLAVVVDEYGGTAGVVTMEDILEEIVGSIQDEYDDEQEPIVENSDGSLLLDGTALLEDVSERLALTIPEDADFDTIGGFVTYLLGRIPAEGETPEVCFEDVVFKVNEVRDRRIISLTAKKTEESQ